MQQTYLLAIQLYEAAVAAGAPRDVCQLCGTPVAEGVKGCWELAAVLLIREYPDGLVGGATFMAWTRTPSSIPKSTARRTTPPTCCTCIGSSSTIRRHGWAPCRAGGNSICKGAAPSPGLDPPQDRGRITVADVVAATSAHAAAVLMEQWARSVYAAWHVHHDWARRELARVLK